MYLFSSECAVGSSKSMSIKILINHACHHNYTYINQVGCMLYAPPAPSHKISLLQMAIFYMDSCTMYIW